MGGAVGSLVYMKIGIHITWIVISMIISAAINAGLAVLCFCCYCKKNSSSGAEVALVAEVGGDIEVEMEVEAPTLEIEVDVEAPEIEVEVEAPCVEIEVEAPEVELEVEAKLKSRLKSRLRPKL